MRRAIGLALVAHALLALAMRGVPLAPPLAVSPPPDAAIEIEPLVETAAETAAVPHEEHVSTGTGAVGATPARATTSNASSSSAIVAAAAIETGAADAGWFDPLQHAAAPPALLGRRVELAPSTATENTPRSDGAITAVRDALNAHDQSIGLGRAGPLQAAAHEAASASTAPDTGVGQIEIICDGEGHVTGVRTSQSDWQPVATKLARMMAGKTMRVRPGSQGLSVKLRIVAERTPPAGTSNNQISAGAVPDDACDGEGLTRRCVAGMPLGVTVKGHDLSNIGAALGRIVHVQVDSETDL